MFHLALKKQNWNVVILFFVTYKDESAILRLPGDTRLENNTALGTRPLKVFASLSWRAPLAHVNDEGILIAYYNC